MEVINEKIQKNSNENISTSSADEVNISDKIRLELQKPGVLEAVREFIFNKNISYEDNPLKEIRK